MAESVNNLTIPYDQIAQRFQAAQDGDDFYQVAVNVPFDYPAEAAQLFLSFLTLNLIDETKQELYLAASSDTEGYRLSIQGYDFDPKTYRIKLDDPKSPLIRAITTKAAQTIKDWARLGRPQASPDTVRLNQATSGVTYSVIYPLSGEVRGAIMYSFVQYQGNIGPEQCDFMEKYTDHISERLETFSS